MPSSSPAPNQLGVPASYQGVNFLCDQRAQPRIVTGIASPDGINTINLKSRTTGAVHKFFVSYIDHDNISDYTVFYDAIKSLRLQ